MTEKPAENLPAEPFERAVALEKEASRLYREKKSEEAFDAFDQAGQLFSECGEHLKAAVCFASAATCWNILTGWQPLNKAATRSYRAAQEAVRGKNYDYARALYHDAALLYEKEGDSENYSRCFIESKQADAQKHWMLFCGIGMFAGLPSESVCLKDRLHALRRWLMHHVDYHVWGYGEQPFRTLLIGFLIILMNALIFSFSGLTTTPEGPRQINLLEALYMSVITFTTVGYGDYLPLGWTRVFAAFEAFSGVFLTPLFIVSLTRRYLRIDR